MEILVVMVTAAVFAVMAAVVVLGMRGSIAQSEIIAAVVFVAVSMLGARGLGAPVPELASWAIFSVALGGVVVLFLVAFDGVVADAFGLPIGLLIFTVIFSLGVSDSLEKADQQFRTGIQAIEQDFAARRDRFISGAFYAMFRQCRTT
jgi:hypothetical protein